jgi:dipeptidyl aminopeptidase/acylaminoacyl peptidase
MVSHLVAVMVTSVTARLALALLGIQVVLATMLLLPVRGLAGQIMFTSQRDGNAEIYLFDLDQRRLTNLTDSLDDDYDSVWSPDGSRIAFVTVRAGNVDVYLVDIERQIVAALTRDPAPDESPAWRP